MAASFSQTAAPEAAPSAVLERPTPGIARGPIAVPAWVVATLGTVIVLAGLAVVALRLFRQVRR